MMKISEIRQLQTAISEIPSGAKAVHESAFRSYHILQKVKDLLARNVPVDVILELVAEMEE